MAKDLIADIKKKASTKKPTSKKKEEVVWSPDAELEPLLAELLAAGSVANLLNPYIDQKKEVVHNRLFDRFTEQMWEKRQQPSNPRVAINKGNTQVRDSSCMFIVKFRRDGLKNYLPDEDELDGQDPRDVLISDLVEITGVSQENAEKLCDEENGEFLIENRITTVKSFDQCYYGDDPALKSAAEKFLKYWQSLATPAGHGGKSKPKKTVSLPVFTEEEQAIIQVQQVLMLKEGFLSRVCMYCETLEQLRELLRFVKISFFTQNYEFAIGDEQSVRISRQEEAVKKVLFVDSEAA